MTEVICLKSEWPMLPMVMVWKMKAGSRNIASEGFVLTTVSDVKMHKGWL